MDNLQNTISTAITLWETSIRTNSNKALPRSIFGGTKEQNHQIAVELFKHVFEKVLEWSPIDVVNFLSMKYIQDLNLQKPFNALDYPPEYKDRRCATFYVGILCYPQLRHYFNEKTIWIMEYNNNIDKGRNHYISFDEENLNKASKKARFLLNYVLRTDCELQFKNIEDLYAFFSQKKAKRWLASKKLGAAVCFFESPLDYLHQSLPRNVESGGRNDFVLQITEFNKLLKDSKGQGSI